MGFYDVDFNVLASWQMLGPRLRRSVQRAWLQCLIAPVVYVYGLFMRNRAANIYALTHNTQVFSIELVLNDTFDPNDRRIYLTDPYVDLTTWLALDYEVGSTVYASPMWLAVDSEVGSTSYTAPVSLYLDAEVSSTGYDFIVWVPVTLVYDAARMRAVVNYYRLPTKSNWAVATF